MDCKLPFTQPGEYQSFSALLFVHMPTNGSLFGFYPCPEIRENDMPKPTHFMLVLIPHVAF